MFTWKYYTLGCIQAAVDKKVAKLQHEIDAIKGERMQYHIRQYLKYDKWFKKLAATGKYPDGKLDKVWDKVEDYAMEIESVLAGEYDIKLPGASQVELPL